MNSLPLSYVNGFSITSVEGTKVVFAGGFRYHPNYTALTVVFDGVLDENEDDIQWKQLPDFKIARSERAAFYLRYKLYIAGGVDNLTVWLDSCEVYDTLEGTWSNGPNLPCPLVCSSTATDPNGTIALIICKKNPMDQPSMIILFEDNDTFKEIDETDMDLVATVI